MHPLLRQTAHRPFPLPKHPWVHRQTWHDLLFAHWALDPEHVRAAIPQPLRPFLDVRDGKAWVGVIPFWMSNVRMRWMPPVPTAGKFPELNVRTYLTIDGKPGVYFFSLDAGSLLAVIGARLGYALPYFHARMQVLHGTERIVGDWRSAGPKRDSKVHRVEVVFHAKPGTLSGVPDAIGYMSSRRRPPNQAQLMARYTPTGPEFNAAPGSIEQFLVERYCLYTARGKKILRGNIHHVPWPLQVAEADIMLNTMAEAARITLPDEQPLLHYAKEMPVLVWAPERVSLRQG
jgi:uncharacterized protein